MQVAQFKWDHKLFVSCFCMNVDEISCHVANQKGRDLNSTDSEAPPLPGSRETGRGSVTQVKLQALQFV